jgi:hypothetical protein
MVFAKHIDGFQLGVVAPPASLPIMRQTLQRFTIRWDGACGIHHLDSAHHYAIGSHNGRAGRTARLTMT